MLSAGSLPERASVIGSSDSARILSAGLTFDFKNKPAFSVFGQKLERALTCEVEIIKFKITKKAASAMPAVFNLSIKIAQAAPITGKRKISAKTLCWWTDWLSPVIRCTKRGRIAPNAKIATSAPALFATICQKAGIEAKKTTGE